MNFLRSAYNSISDYLWPNSGTANTQPTNNTNITDGDYQDPEEADNEIYETKFDQHIKTYMLENWINENEDLSRFTVYSRYDSIRATNTNFEILTENGSIAMQKAVTDILDHVKSDMNLVDICLFATLDYQRGENSEPEAYTRSRRVGLIDLTTGDYSKITTAVNILIGEHEDFLENSPNSDLSNNTNGLGDFTILAKFINSGAGGVIVNQEIEHLIFNPRGGNCLLSCLVESGLVFNVMNLLDKTKINAANAIPKNKIGTVLTHADPEGKYFIRLWKFEERAMVKSNTYPTRVKIEDRTIIDLLLHLGHYMIIRDIKMKHLIKPEHFTHILEVPTEPVDYTPTFEEMHKAQPAPWDLKDGEPLIIPPDPPIKPDDIIYKNRYYFDAEAFKKAIGPNKSDQISYAIGLTKVENVFNVKQQKIKNIAPKPDCLDTVKIFYGLNCLTEFAMHLKQLADRAHLLHVSAVLSEVAKVVNMVEINKDGKLQRSLFTSKTLPPYILSKAETDKVIQCIRDFNENDYYHNGYKMSNKTNEVTDIIPIRLTKWHLQGIIREAKKKYVITMVGFNNARYDNYLLLNNKIFQGAINNVLKSHGLLSVTVFGYIVFEDMMRHVGPQSLAKTCKALNVPAKFSKGEFPHDFASEETIEYNGIIPRAELWPSGKIPDEFIEYTNYKNWTRDANNKLIIPLAFIKRHGIKTHDREILINTKNAELPEIYDAMSKKYGIIKKPWNFKQVSIDYLRHDIIALAIADVYFTRGMAEVTGLNRQKFLTLPALAYNFAKIKLNHEDIRPIKQRDADKLIRAAIKGGRVIVNKGTHKAEHYKEILELKANGQWDDMTQAQRKALFSKIRNGLVYIDAVSLYPTAMTKFKYPVGVAVYNLNTDEIMEQLNNLTYDKLAIVECDYVYTKPVFQPLLGTFDGECRIYDCKPGNRESLTSVDIMQAVKYNAVKVTKIYKVLEWSKSADIFSGFTQELFNRRLAYKKEGNKVMTELIKLCLNSIYGKYTEKHQTENVKHTKYNELLEDVLINSNEKKLTKFDIISDGAIAEITFEEEIAIDKTKPVHLGAFILAYSKQIMNEAIDAIGGFNSPEQAIYYTDTDSMIIKKEAYDILRTKLNSFGMPFLGSELGQMHDDLGTGEDEKLGTSESLIIEGYWIQPKTYAVKWVGYKNVEGVEVLDVHTTIKAKGVHNSAKTLTFNDFQNMHNNNAIIEDIPQTTFARVHKWDQYGINIVNNTKKIGGLWNGRRRVGDIYYPWAYPAVS